MMNNIETFDVDEYVDINSESGGYLNLSHSYRILVPKNSDAAERLYVYDIYDNGEICSDMVCLEFHEDTFYYMESRILDFINVECDLLINMYEEEVLENEQLDSAINIVDILVRNSDDDAVITFGKKLLDLMRLAKECGTVVGFYF